MCRAAAQLILDETVVNGNKLMTALAVKPGMRPTANIADSKNALVAVVLVAVRADYLRRAHALAAYVLQRVVHARELEAQLLVVAHVPRVAPAAPAEIRAFGRAARGRGDNEPFRARVHRARRDLDYADIPRLANDDARHEHGAPAYAADAAGLRGVPLNLGCIHIIFLQIIHNKK